MQMSVGDFEFSIEPRNNGTCACIRRVIGDPAKTPEEVREKDMPPEVQKKYWEAFYGNLHQHEVQLAGR